MNLWPRCSQREDYLLAVGSLFSGLIAIPGNLLTLCVVFFQPCLPFRHFFSRSGCVVARFNIGTDRVDTFEKGFGLSRAK